MELDMDEDCPSVLADPTQMHQVLMNLSTNAAHAMREKGGWLRVTLQKVTVNEAQATEMLQLRPGDYVKMAVSDTGHGMNRATMDRIFDPFFTTKAPGEGTGLGLAVVHGIMRSHGGTITVQSETGAGTTFHLYFPALALAKGSPGAQESELPRGSGQRVLLVDDEEGVVSTISRLLERLNYQVVEYSRPAEALEAFRRTPNQFELVLTDLTMPLVNGLTLARQIHDLRPTIPVVLMTGYSGKAVDLKLDDAGISQVLSKPVSLRALAETVYQETHASAPARASG
jgi:CheY-like chemotaxis protein